MSVSLKGAILHVGQLGPIEGTDAPAQGSLYATLTKTLQLGGGLIGYVKSKPLGNGQIISIDALVIVMIIAIFHKS